MPANEPTLLGLAASTWVAIVALAFSAGVSIAATFVANKSQKEDRQHRAEQAREERLQARLQAAYANLAIHLDRLGEAISRSLAKGTEEPPLPPIKEPDYEEMRVQTAPAKVLGSAEVRIQLSQLSEQVFAFRIKEGAWRIEVGLGSTSSKTGAAFDEAVAQKQVVLDAVKQLLDQMRTELGSNQD